MSYIQSIFCDFVVKRLTLMIDGCEIAHDCVQLYGYTVI